MGEEYVVLDPSGGIVAGPFRREEDAERWVRSYVGQVHLARWGRLLVARRQVEAPPAPVARWPSRQHVPAPVWSLASTADLVLVELPTGEVEAWI